MKYIVDRIEGKFFVCESEDKTMINIPIKKAVSAKIGDVLCIINNKIIVDKNETEKRKEIMNKIMEDIWEE